MLRRRGLIEFVNIYQCKRSQRDVQIELVFEINLVVVVVAQFLGQQYLAESRLATPLSSYQQRCQCVTRQLALALSPLRHHSHQPVAQVFLPLWLIGRHTLCQFPDSVLPVPFRQFVEPLVHGVVLLDMHRVDESVHVLVKALQPHFCCRERHAVAHFRRKGFKVLVVREFLTIFSHTGQQVLAHFIV